MDYDTSITSVEKLAKMLALFSGISYEDALVVAQESMETETPEEELERLREENKELQRQVRELEN